MDNINTQSNEWNSKEKKSTEFCQQCPNHCPADALKCGRGRNYFGESEERGTDYGRRRGRESGENGDGMHGGRNHRGHGRLNENCNPDSLYGLMRGCGHYLYRRCGKEIGNSQERILSILLTQDNMTQKQLQKILDIQPGSLSEILTKLEDKELLVRQKDEEDKRRSILTLTEKGKEIARKNNCEEQEQQLFSCLEESEQETLKLLLKKLRESWKEQ